MQTSVLYRSLQLKPFQSPVVIFKKKKKKLATKITEIKAAKKYPSYKSVAHAENVPLWQFITTEIAAIEPPVDSLLVCIVEVVQPVKYMNRI